MKIKLKKLLVTIFTFAILLQPFATVKANGSKDSVLNESGYLPYTYSASGDSHGGDFATRYGQLRKLYMGGQVVFCVEPWNAATAGTVYTNYDFPASVRSRMSYIAYHGYLTHQTDEWYMASQLMIWEELGWTINSTNLPNYQGMKNTINTLINQHHDKPSWENKTYNYNKQIEFTDALNSEFDVIDSNGFQIAKVGDTFYVNKNGKAPGTYKIMFEKYTDAFTNTSNVLYESNDSQNVAKLYNNDPVRISINVTIPPENGGFKLYKTDENGTPIAGVKFKYGKNLNGTPNSDEGYWTGTTDSNGIISSKDWAPGTKIYLQEISAPSNLIVDPTVKSFTIESGKDVSYYVENKIKKAPLKITKVDEFGNLIPNTKFKVSRNADMSNTLGNYTTGSDGTVTIPNLTEGTYYVQELQAPNNLVVDNKIYPVNVAYGKVGSFTSHNHYKRGRILLDKHDFDTNNTLQNVTFELATDRAFTNIISTKVTDAQGLVSFDNLLMGKYYVREKGTPTGYVTNNEIHEFTLVNDQQTLTKKINNTPIKAQVTIKKEAELLTKYEIKGNVFEPVYQVGLLKDVTYNIVANEDIILADGSKAYTNGDIVETLTTNATQPVVSNKIPLGKYYLVETQTAPGYVLDSTHYEFELKAKDTVTEIVTHLEEHKNDKQKATITLDKTIEDSIFLDKNETVKDITFGLYVAEDILNEKKEVILSKDSLLAVSNLTNLKATFNVDLEGKYYVRELTTNANYVLDTTKHYFDYLYKGNKLEVLSFNDGSKVFENKLKRSKVEITKKSENEELLKGVEYSISDKSDMSNILGTAITDANGKIVFDGLELGNYFIKETKALDGYVIDNKIYPVVADEDATNDNYNFKNYLKRSKVEITKKSENEELLKGVEYSISDKSDMSNILGTAITDANGKIVFDGLVLGNYFIKETKALEGYVIDNKIYPVVADEDATNDNHDFINHLKRMDVRIKKIDSITGKVLRAAEFTLFDKDGKAITVVKTDKDGIAIFKDVAYGFEGYIMETKAPVGYILSKEKVKVVFNKDMKLDADNLLVIAYPNTPIQDDVVTGVAKPSNTIYTLTALISLGGIVALKRKKKHV